MTEPAFLTDLLAGAGNPVAQGILAALCTFILEDPTTITCGLLVADGRMSFESAAVGLSIGIAVGDLGLYALGYLLADKAVAWGWVTREHLERGRELAERHLITAVVAARFVPGMRIPCYAGAGAVRAPFWKFALIAAVASTIWTLLLLHLTVALGRAIFPLLEEWRWPVALGFLALLLGAQTLARRTALGRSSESKDDPPVASTFEFWPAWLFYIPVSLYYVGLAIRHRSVMLPSCANPSIYSGGISKESKSQILGLIPDQWSKHVPRYVTFTVLPDANAELAQEVMRQAGLSFPIVAKPDAGQRGDGVRRVDHAGELAAYLERFPRGAVVILQQLAQWVPEAGIFYARHPDEQQGRVLSLTLKEFPEVVGDGRRTLRELIASDARARLMAHVYMNRHAHRLNDVLADGERFRLVFAGNHCQGAVFRDGGHLITEELTARFDAIARSMPGFYFGRFDVKYRDLDSLRAGEHFEILEVNGASAECTHIWDPAMKLPDAYRVLFRQFSILFSIGAANRARGARPLPARQLFRDYLDYRRLANRYPPTA